MPAGSTSTSLSITNPLVLYRALVATHKISPDPAQHRLALQLQKLYFRLKDYSPELEYRHRLEQISRSIPQAENVSQQRPGPPSPPPSLGFLTSLFRTADGRSTLSLARTVSIHDSALNIDSPQGMLLYGEVGRGKSMLLDLLYSSLPSRKKRRWHFNTFMLDIFRRLEKARVERAVLRHHIEHEHAVLTLAKDTVANSPILFLDEFQMPDRAASKLLNGFMTSFFHLGGVLVASSNRMPDELAKASGIEFQGSRSRSRGVFGWGMQRFSEGEKGAQGDFGQFLEVLKARCEVWEMEGERDWRREHGEEPASDEELEEIMGEERISYAADVKSEDVALTEELNESLSSDSPPHYHLRLESSSPTTFAAQIEALNPCGQWSPTTLHIYSRPLHLPTTNAGVALATFGDMCARNLGPADYTSLCSHFHTLILTDVPVLTLLLKNEARRFITLLDALYEGRCRLLIEAAAPPDKLFFPETRTRYAAGPGIEPPNPIDSEAYSEMYQDSTLPFRPNVSSYDTRGESIDSEAYSEMYQDSTAPFRPNVSTYGATSDKSARPTFSPQSQLRSVLADEDADFGPTYGNGRSHGASNNDLAQLEAQQKYQESIGPDFTNLSGLTGQDEMFAFKRARSRLWEMCGNKWWRERAGDPANWHIPINSEGRFWEKTLGSVTAATGTVPLSGEDLSGMQGTHDGSRSKADDLYRDRDDLFKHGASPYRVSEEPPPKFSLWHAWGLGEWGKKGSGEAKRLRESKRRDRTPQEAEANDWR